MHRILTALLLLSATAGCVDTPDAAPVPAEPTTITDPTDFEYNASQAHVHDYWGGQDQLTIFSRTATRHATTLDGDLGLAIRPDRDEVVPQGTARVDMVWHWTSDAPADTYGTPIALVTTAATDDWTELGPITNGEAVTIETTNDDNDKPHARLSGWTFGLRFPQETPTVNRVEGEARLELIAHRGLDIPEYPGHPDRWEGRDRIDLVSYTGTAMAVDSGGGRLCVMGCPPELRSEAIVPHDAASVEVVLQAPGPIGDVGLAYHGADTWEFTVAEPVEDGAGTKRFILPVDGTGDGPYAIKSLWEFAVIILGDGPADPYSGDLSLEAWALAEAA